jgi:hypothetical protein
LRLIWLHLFSAFLSGRSDLTIDVVMTFISLFVIRKETLPVASWVWYFMFV